MTSEQLTMVLVAAMAAPGFWEAIKSLIGAFFGRKHVTNEDIADSLAEIKRGYDSQQKDIDGLRNSIENMRTEEATKDAQAARRRILRFNDELLRDVDHSKEYFDDILEDIKTYDDYCQADPSFQNGKTVMAERNIQRCYEHCMEKHSFLS